MSDFINNGNRKQENEEPQSDTKKYFWISVVCCAVGAVLMGISFIPFKVNAGQYFIFGSMIAELAAITFLNVQKRYNYFLACKIVRVISYLFMIACAGIIGGVAVFKLANS